MVSLSIIDQTSTIRPTIEPVEDVLRERDSPTCGLETQKRMLWSALEDEPAGHDLIVGHQELRDELKIRYRHVSASSIAR